MCVVHKLGTHTCTLLYHWDKANVRFHHVSTCLHGCILKPHKPSHTYMYIHVHVHTCTYMYIHVHTCTCMFFDVLFIYCSHWLVCLYWCTCTCAYTASTFICLFSVSQANNVSQCSSVHVTHGVYNVACLLISASAMWFMSTYRHWFTNATIDIKVYLKTWL